MTAINAMAPFQNVFHVDWEQAFRRYLLIRCVSYPFLSCVLYS